MENVQEQGPQALYHKELAKSQPRNLDQFFQTAYDNNKTDEADNEIEEAVTILSTSKIDATTVGGTPLPPPPRHHFFNSSKLQYGIIIGSIGISSAADAAEMFSIGYILGEHDFQQNVLHNDLAQGGAIVAGILNIGLVFGGIIASAAEGRIWGRKTTLIIGLSITSMGGLLCAMSSSIISFATCRFIAGFGIGAILSCSATLATEISPPKQRGFIVSITQSFWTVGEVGNAVLAYLIFAVFQNYSYSGWRLYAVMTALPSIIGLLLVIWVVPESPRYLALQGKYDLAAMNANLTASAMGYTGTPLEMSEIEYYYDKEHLTPNNRYRHGKEDSAWQLSSPLSNISLIRLHLQQGMKNVKMIYTSSELCKQAVTVQILWTIVSIAAALAFWINTIFHSIGLSNIYLNFIILNCALAPGNIACVTLTDRMGRNKFLMWAMGIASAALFAVSWLVSTDISGIGGDNESKSMPTTKTSSIVFCTAFYYASLTSCYTVLYIMASELFPTNTRATGVVLCSTFGRIAVFLAQFLIGALIDNPSTLLNVAATVLLSGALMTWIMPPQEMSLKPVRDDLVFEDNTRRTAFKSSPPTSPSLQLVEDINKQKKKATMVVNENNNTNEERHYILDEQTRSDVDEELSPLYFRSHYSSTDN